MTWQTRPVSEADFYARYPCPSCKGSPLVYSYITRQITQKINHYGEIQICLTLFPIAFQELQYSWLANRWEHPKYVLKCANETKGCYSKSLDSSTTSRGLREYWYYRLWRLKNDPRNTTHA